VEHLQNVEKLKEKDTMIVDTAINLARQNPTTVIGERH